MQTHNRPGIDEMVGLALARGDLTPRETNCGLDKVMALGMVGMEERITDAIFRLKYANDHKAYADANKAVTDLARRLNTTENWNQGSRLATIATAALNYWLADMCPACTGKRDDPDKMGPTSMPMTGTPYLDGVTCDACGGSGKRPYPWLREKGRIGHYHTVLLVAIECAERRIRDKLITKLSNQIREVIE